MSDRLKACKCTPLTRRQMDDLIRWEMSYFAWKEGVRLTKEAAFLAFVYQTYGQRPFSRELAVAVFTNSFPTLGSIANTLADQLAYGTLMSTKRNGREIALALTSNGQRYLGQFLELDRAVAA